MATASQQNPVYTVYIIAAGTGVKYDVTPALVALDRSERKKQIAQSVTIQLRNVLVEDTWLSGLINVRDRVYVYANDGSRHEEVFRGYVWTRTYKSSSTNWELKLKCYDNLIYMQESEESLFFASGKSTKYICGYICDKWGIKLEYSYESITHSKQALRGHLSDIFTADILDLVKTRTGKKYVIQSIEDVMHIKTVGSNSTVYQFLSGKNAIQTTSECTMDDMVTKVVIVGKADDDDRRPVEATVSGETDKYGTLQKIVNRDENTSLADAKKEAQEIIDESGSPTWEDELTAPDIPWIRVGDMIYVHTGDIKGYRIVTGISRSIDSKSNKMILTLERV